MSFAEFKNTSAAVGQYLATTVSRSTNLAELRVVLSDPALSDHLQNFTVESLLTGGASTAAAEPKPEGSLSYRIINLLKEKGGWMTAAELAVEMDSSAAYITNTLTKNIREIASFPIVCRARKSYNLRGKPPREYSWVNFNA